MSFIPPEIYLGIAHANQVNAYNSIACASWLVYNNIIHFGEEVTFITNFWTSGRLNELVKVDAIWKARWTGIKLLYVVMRYFGPTWLIYNFAMNAISGAHLSLLLQVVSGFPDVCFPLSSGPMLLSITTDTIILVRLRVWYEAESYKLQYGFILAYYGLIAIVCPSVLASSVTANAPVPGIRGCVPPFIAQEHLYLAKTPLMLQLSMNIVILALTLIKFLQTIYLKDVGKSTTISFQSLFGIFFAEGVLYFVGYIGTYLVSTIIIWGKPALLAYVNVSQCYAVTIDLFLILQLVMTNIFRHQGSSLILHLRIAGRASLRQPVTFNNCTDLIFRIDQQLDAQRQSVETRVN
ncbi:hypothetical protein JR316_0011343 [Psilocybe cubensis]|uniref:Uncharacterized protein n=2 Tax=Psilocybe cubensis TaxID=181762 RepID=A0ACB8GJV7_PSICU|nr:hypothetical protein JR316_0011343 [Psilocybe cubensis]KAH9475784.1 hypothetical protein JR316_0011343 [Psilocybe cubensis]